MTRVGSIKLGNQNFAIDTNIKFYFRGIAAADKMLITHIVRRIFYCRGVCSTIVGRMRRTPCWIWKPGHFYRQKPLGTATVPSGTNIIFGVLIYRGIPSDLQSRPEQSHHLLGLCSPRRLQVAGGVPNWRPHLPSSITVQRFTIYVKPFQITIKRAWYLTKSRPLDAGLILTSFFAECVRRPGGVESSKGLKFLMTLRLKASFTSPSLSLHALTISAHSAF